MDADSKARVSSEDRRGRARHVLRRHWKHADFRPGQFEAIEAVMEDRDALVILPTGGGKSVCYQVPALLREGLTLVISPLIALMHDQVSGLRARGIQAAFIDSTLSRRTVEQRWTDAEFGRYDLLYVAPERLQSELFQARAGRLPVSLLAVDEAHCVSEWGRHFRPAYRKIPEGRRQLGDPPTIAVTATAPPEVRRDIVGLLELEDPRRIVTGFDRPNVTWSIFQPENKRSKIREVVGQVEGSGLVYAATRRSTEARAHWLQGEGVSVDYYHAGRSPEERKAVQEAWLRGDTRVLVATNAFGMGIDKPDVRFVVHADAPASLEAYYQQAGRVGRDGERAHAVLLFSPSDARTQRALIDSSHPDATAVQEVYTAVCNIGQVPIGSQPDEPLAVDVETIQQLTGHSRTAIITAVELLERQGAWVRYPQRYRYGKIRFRKSAEALRRHVKRMQNRALANFLQVLLRTVHAEAFARWRDVDLWLLKRRTDLPRGRLLRGLAFLERRGLIGWRPPGKALEVELAAPRGRTFPIDYAEVRRDRRRAERRLRHFLRYARSITCRRQFLLNYFGEGAPAQCGRCDVCLGRHEPPVITPDDEAALRSILQAVREGKPRGQWLSEESSSSAGSGDGAHRSRRDALARWLVQNGYMRLKAPLEGRFALTSRAHAFLEEEG